MAPGEDAASFEDRACSEAAERLDEIPGIGPVRKRALLRAFGRCGHDGVVNPLVCRHRRVALCAVFAALADPHDILRIAKVTNC